MNDYRAKQNCESNEPRLPLARPDACKTRQAVQNILMSGSPGSGKTLLASALPGILPEIRIEESLNVTRIYSVESIRYSKSSPCEAENTLILGKKMQLKRGRLVACFIPDE